MSTTKGSKLEAKDEKFVLFVLQAAQGGMTEVKLGEIASRKRTHPNQSNQR